MVYMAAYDIIFIIGLIADVHSSYIIPCYGVHNRSGPGEPMLHRLCRALFGQ